MELIKLVLAWVFGALFTCFKYLFYGQILKNKTGSKILKPKEIKGFLSPAHKGLLIDGQKNRLSVPESYQNVCFVARVGAGKTTKYIIPNVLDKAKENLSMVVNDPKGEVCDLTAGYLKAKNNPCDDYCNACLFINKQHIFNQSLNSIEYKNLIIYNKDKANAVDLFRLCYIRKMEIINNVK